MEIALSKVNQFVKKYSKIYHFESKKDMLL